MKARVLILILSMAAYTAMSQTFNTNGSWNVGGNWSTGSVPSGTGTNVTLSADPQLLSGANNVIGNITVDNNVTIQSAANSVLTVGSSALFSGGTKKSITFNNNGTIQISSGSPDGKIEIWGDLIVNNNLTLQVTGAFIVHGNIQMNNNAAIQVSGGGTINVGGNVTGGNNETIQVSGSGSSIQIAGSLSLGNGGVIQVAGGGVISAGGGCVCSGCQSQCSSLPVTLASFQANLSEEMVTLTWSTSSEKNFDYFSVERSHNGKEFQEIGQVKGNGTTVEKHEYSFQDALPLAGKNYYRLKSVDYNTHVETFNILFVNIFNSKLVHVSPNPANGDQISIVTNFSHEENSRVDIFDNVGVHMGTYPMSQDGTIVFSNPLKPGVYYAKYAAGTYSQSAKFIVR